MKPFCRVLLPLFTVALLVSPLSASAQHPESRLSGAIHDSARLTLAHSVSPQTRIADDLGEVSSETAVPGITLVFKRSATQETALQQLLAAQLNPASAEYRQWLTPEAFADRFGVADQDIATTEAWLTSHGFHVDRVSRAHDRITFSGNAGQVQSAFGTALHHYIIQGKRHLAPASDLTLPAELAAITSAVLHLEDFRPLPSVKTPARLRLEPDYTTASTQVHYLGPKDIAVMYNLNPLYQSAGYGSGQGLAILGQSYVNTGEPSSVYSFQTSLTQTDSLSSVLVPGSGVDAIVPGDEGESEIDIEYSSGIAQDAKVFFIYVGDNQSYSVFDSLAFAIEENIAPVLSLSYGTCESLVSQSYLEQSNALFEQAGSQGQTIVASAGDAGSTGCAPFTATGQATVAQQQALAVNFPADSPYVTAVGGTQMAAGTFTAGANTYWAASTNSSQDNPNSLLSYVPEVVWNENSTENGIVAGGGGTSDYFPRPTWQSGVPGIVSGAYRLVPDLSLQASIEAPGYVLCTDDPYLLGDQTQSCVNGLEGSSDKYTTAGGTSFAAPIFAGFVAVLNQAQHTLGLGNINPTLYKLAANSATYASAFHDITSGTNACTAGVGTCSTAGESGYAATTGYDEATGLGSVDFNALATAWPTSGTATLTGTSTVLNGPADVTAGVAVTMQVYISPISQGTATVPVSGNVSILLDGVSTGAPLVLTPEAGNLDATVSYTFTPSASASAGSHLVTVNYLGNTVYAPSISTYSFLVGDASASGGLTLSASNLTVANNGSGSTLVTVTPTSGYHGRVTWSLSAATTGTTALSGCYILDSLEVSAATTAKLTFGVGTACDSALPAARKSVLIQPRHAVSMKDSPLLPRSIPPAAMYAGLTLCGLLAGRRKKLIHLLPVLFAAVLALGLAGCGGSSGTASTPSQPAATYTITVTGTDSVNSTISATTTFTLNVN